LAVHGMSAALRSSRPDGAAEAVSSGDLDVGRIYKAELAYLWRSFLRLGVAAGDVEDLAHELFVVVHRRRESYDSGRPLRPWLFGIAVRITKAHFRRAHVRREVVSDQLEPTEPGNSPEESLVLQRRRALVLAALQPLPMEQRAAFVLHEIDGFAAPEIAEALEVPLNTVYSRIRLGREKFQREVQRLSRISQRRRPQGGIR